MSEPSWKPQAPTADLITPLIKKIVTYVAQFLQGIRMESALMCIILNDRDIFVQEIMK